MLGVACKQSGTGKGGSDECYFYAAWTLAYEDQNLPITVLSALLAASGDNDMQDMLTSGKIPANTQVSAQTTAALIYLSAILPTEITNALTAAFTAGTTDPKALNLVMRQIADKDLNISSVIGNLSSAGAPANTDYHGTTVYRLKEGIERFLITDINNPAGGAKAQSNIQTMADLWAVTPADFNHVPGGANILFMDGHVEFRRYPNPPVTSGMAAIIGFSA